MTEESKLPQEQNKKHNRFWRKFVLSTVLVGSFFTTAFKASAASAPKKITEYAAKELKKRFTSDFSDADLKKFCDNYAQHAIQQGIYTAILDSTYNAVGDSLEANIRKIHGKMTANKRNIDNYLSDNALGGEHFGAPGLFNKAPLGSHCAWSAIRSFYKTVKDTGNEVYFGGLLEKLENANYAYGGFAESTFASSPLLHKKTKDRNINSTLINDIQDHPTDIFLVTMASPQANSGCHVVLARGSEIFSYNNETITSTEKYINAKWFKGVRNYINLSEYSRQNLNETQLTQDLSDALYASLKDKINSNEFEPFLAGKVTNDSTPEIEKDAYTKLFRQMALNKTLQNKQGNDLLQNGVEEINTTVINGLNSMLASNNISAERKIEISTMFQDILPTVTEAQPNNLSEEEILINMSQSFGNIYTNTCKKIHQANNIENGSKVLYLKAWESINQPIIESMTQENQQENTFALERSDTRSSGDILQALREALDTNKKIQSVENSNDQQNDPSIQKPVRKNRDITS